MQRGVVVGHAARRLVQPEGDHRQLPAEPRVVRDRIGAVGKGEQRVGAAAAGLDGHGDVARAGHDHPVGQRLAPGLEHHPPLLGRQVRPSSGMGPDGHAGDGLRGHPPRVVPLRGWRRAPCRGTGRARRGPGPHVAAASAVHAAGPVMPGSVIAAEAAALPLSIAARSAAEQVEQVELGAGVLGNPERLPGAEHEARGADRAEQRLQVVLGRAPDPADVPPDARRPRPASSRSGPPR